MDEVTGGHDHEAGTKRKESYQEKSNLSTSHEDLLRLVMSGFSDRLGSFYHCAFLAAIGPRKFQRDPAEDEIRQEHTGGIKPDWSPLEKRIHQRDHHQQGEGQRCEELPIEAQHVIDTD